MPNRSASSTSKPAANQIAIDALGDDHVCGDRAEARGHGPDVKVVDRAHSVHSADGGAESLDVDPGGSRLHQHVERLHDQSPGGGEDEDRDQQADDRVDDRRTAGENDGARDDDTERAERVGGAVAQHPLEVEVLALAAGEDQGRGEVAGKAECAKGQHAGAVDRRRIAQPPDRGNGDPDPDRDQEQPVDQRGEHLRALIAKSAATSGRPGSEVGGGEGEGDRADVGK